MYLAYWAHYRGSISLIGDNPIPMGRDSYYELIKIVWTYRDDLGVIKGRFGNKDVVNFSSYDFMKTFDSIPDATKFVIREIFK